MCLTTVQFDNCVKMVSASAGDVFPFGFRATTIDAAHFK